MTNKYTESSPIIEGVNNLFVVIDWKITTDVPIDAPTNNIRINFFETALELIFKYIKI